MIAVCAPQPQHIDSAYALFCSHRESPWSKALFESSLHKPFSLLALQDSTLLGFIVISHVLDEAELEDICVDPAYRQRGVARALLRSSMASLRARGIKKWHLEVRQSNRPAIRLYESLGFVKVGERKAYYSKASNIDGHETAEAALLYSLHL